MQTVISKWDQVQQGSIFFYCSTVKKKTHADPICIITKPQKYNILILSPLLKIQVLYQLLPTSYVEKSLVFYYDFFVPKWTMHFYFELHYSVVHRARTKERWWMEGCIVHRVRGGQGFWHYVDLFPMEIQCTEAAFEIRKALGGLEGLLRLFFWNYQINNLRSANFTYSVDPTVGGTFPSSGCLETSRAEAWGRPKTVR